MNDTVTKILALADEYASRKQWSSRQSAEVKRNELKAELTRLLEVNRAFAEAAKALIPKDRIPDATPDL